MKPVYLFSLLLLISSSCSRLSGDRDVVTERIQYDVTIKNKEADSDWWLQNIEGQKREALIANIIRTASSGKLKLYDYFTNKELSKQDIAAIFKKTDTISVENPNPPYETHDTMMVHQLKPGDITRIRFMEEWKMNRKTLEFTKEVKGICPMLESYSETGEFRGYQPLFWVFFDKDYPGVLQGK